MGSSYLINNLSLHQRYWKIKVLVTEKVKIKDFKSSQGKFQKLTLMDMEMIYRRRDKQKILKRDLQVYGLRSDLLTLTLWEALTTVQGQQLEEVKDDFPVILARSVVGKYFNGFTLSTTSSTILEINPNIPESQEIKDWFATIRENDVTFSNEEYLVTDLLIINTAEHSCGEIKYYDTKVSIRGIKEEGNIWYNACNLCKSKVIISEDLVECTKCSKENVDYRR